MQQGVDACGARHALSDANQNRRVEIRDALAIRELLGHPLDAQSDGNTNRKFLVEPRVNFVQTVADGHSQIGAVVPRVSRPACRVVKSWAGGVGLSPIDAA